MSTNLSALREQLILIVVGPIFLVEPATACNGAMPARQRQVTLSFLEAFHCPNRTGPLMTLRVSARRAGRASHSAGPVTAGTHNMSGPTTHYVSPLV